MKGFTHCQSNANLHCPHMPWNHILSLPGPTWLIWPLTWENVPSDVCAQQRPNSTLISLRCWHEETLHPCLSKMRPVKIQMRSMIWIFAGRTCKKLHFRTSRIICKMLRIFAALKKTSYVCCLSWRIMKPYIFFCCIKTKKGTKKLLKK